MFLSAVFFELAKPVSQLPEAAHQGIDGNRKRDVLNFLAVSIKISSNDWILAQTLIMVSRAMIAGYRLARHFLTSPGRCSVSPVSFADWFWCLLNTIFALIASGPFAVAWFRL